MKYLKTYEERAWNYDIGSYVVINPEYHKEFKEFFETHVGKVTKMFYMGWYKIKFDIPDNASYKLKKYLNCKDYNTVEIEFKSKNKKKSEEYLKIKQNTNKYNL